MQAFIIGTVWPEPNSTAAGMRMLQLIKMLQKANYTIVFASAAQPTQFSAPLTKLGVTCKPITLNSDAFDEVLKQINPDLVLYDRFTTEEQYGWRVTQNCPSVFTILDTEDLHFVRMARQKAYKQNKNLDHVEYQSTYFQREMASILRCDLTLIISKFEMNLLCKEYKIDASILLYIPLLVEEVTPSKQNYNQRKDFMSIGNFLHPPNWHTVLLLKQYWKSIKAQLPEVNLRIYGSYVTPKAEALHNPKEGFIVEGRAPNKAETFKNARVLLAPIPFGAGIKGKLLEAMQFGTPCVTTTIGAEGFGVETNKDWNGFITPTEDEFVEKAVLLYNQQSVWENAQYNGYAILNKGFQYAFFETAFIHTINKLQRHLIEHRKKNYLSFVFKHQSLQSTKFMSKWIAEKNKTKYDL